jgi:hypothetical protein
VDPRHAFRDAALYVAVVFQDATSVAHLQAFDLGVPVFLAVQFPLLSSLSAELACHLSAAHDTVVLGSRLRELLSHPDA